MGTESKTAGPPIIELILGVQFKPLANFITAYAVRFRDEVLGEDWSIKESPRLGDIQVNYDAKAGMAPQGNLVMQFLHGSPVGGERLLFENKNTNRLVQIQNNRIHYNWKKNSENYPKYDVIFREFEDIFAKFVSFIGDKYKIEKPSLTHWEITYLDDIPRGPLWDSTEDWHRIIPGLYPAKMAIEELTLEQHVSIKNYVLGDKKGKMQVVAQLGFVGDSKEPSLFVRTNANGQMDTSTFSTAKDGLDYGHKCIHNAFVTLFSKEALSYWGIK